MQTPNNSIFTITAMTEPNEKQLVDKRTVGYQFSLLKAQNAVEDNLCDMFECFYDLVVIEEILPGAYNLPLNEFWYKWDLNKKKYVGCEKPESLSNQISFGIG